MPTTLDQLKPQQSCIVSGFTLEGPVTQRLMQLGVLEGSDIAILRRAPGGDPIEIRVMGYALSLRKQEAQTIIVEQIV